MAAMRNVAAASLPIVAAQWQRTAYAPAAMNYCARCRRRDHDRDHRHALADGATIAVWG
jgi:hypothetical protein